MISKTVENYLKNIFLLSENNKVVTTNEISRKLKIKASSASDMLKKMKDKGLLNYEKYNGVSLTVKGKKIATTIVRKHRLWETFLVKKLNFNWGEVHEVAEQLEHIKSEDLINKLDKFLNYPKFDPHGEPIPSKDGAIPNRDTIPLNKLNSGDIGLVMGVNLDEKEFLDYLTKLNIRIGTKIEIKDKIDFDQSLNIRIENNNYHISYEVAKHLLIKTKI